MYNVSYKKKKCIKKWYLYNPAPLSGLKINCLTIFKAALDSLPLPCNDEFLFQSWNRLKTWKTSLLFSRNLFLNVFRNMQENIWDVVEIFSFYSKKIDNIFIPSSTISFSLKVALDLHLNLYLNLREFLKGIC